MVGRLRGHVVTRYRMYRKSPDPIGGGQQERGFAARRFKHAI
jgi:hypothetical protein